MPLSTRVLEGLGGKPVELFTFTRNREVWRYTSADRPVVLNGVTFLPAHIKRTPAQRTSDVSATRVTIAMALVTPVAQALLVQSPSVITVSVDRRHPDADPADAEQVINQVTGEVKRVTPKGSMLEVMVATMESYFDQQAPRVLVTRHCQNAVYDWRCGVNRATYEIAFVVSKLDRLNRAMVLQGASVGGDGYYNGAAMRLADGQYLHVRAHVGEEVRTLGPIPDTLADGATVYLAPPCDKTIQMCKERFDNVRNHLGFPFLPDDNIFDGDI